MYILIVSIKSVSLFIKKNTFSYVILKKFEVENQPHGCISFLIKKYINMIPD